MNENTFSEQNAPSRGEIILYQTADGYNKYVNHYLPYDKRDGDIPMRTLSGTGATAHTTAWM